MIIKTNTAPKTFKLQWHITEHCNFRCKHCYQENYDTPEMPLEQMEGVLRQYADLVKKWKISPDRAYLALTGGEPFLHKDFYSFLEKVCKYSANYRWGIYSNGSLLNRENGKILKLFKISTFQVSLEGLEKNNDKIRGKGSFKKTIEALKILNEAEITSVVSLTVSRENLDDVFPLARLLFGIGVNRFFVRRLVPRGEGAGLKDSLLKPEELLRLYRKIEEIDGFLNRKRSFFRVSPSCDNYFFRVNFKPEEHCGVLAGRTLTLMPNGDIYPCRRLPIKTGNIFENSFEEIYYSDKMRELRDINNAPDYCRKNCPSFNKCLGGARCITYACAGRLDIPDPHCPGPEILCQTDKTITTFLENARRLILKRLRSYDGKFYG